MRCARSQADGALSSRPRSGACRRADRVRSDRPRPAWSASSPPAIAAMRCSSKVQRTAAIVSRAAVSAAWARCGEAGDRCSKLARAGDSADRATCSKDRKPHRMYADRGWPSATCRASGKLTGRTSDHRCRGASRRRYGTVPMSSFSSITAQLRPASRCAHRMTVTTRQQRQRGRIDDAVRHPGRRPRPSV